MTNYLKNTEIKYILGKPKDWREASEYFQKQWIPV